MASFDYTVDDGDGGTDTGTVTIDLDCVNDDPVAVDDNLAGDEDSAVVASSDDLTGNDTDADDDELTVTDVSNAVGGSVTLDGGVVTFTPNADLCGDGEGSFDYVVSDGTATDDGHVTIDIECANDNPDATDDEADGTEDQDVVIAAADLIGNDSDVEDVTLSLTGVDNADGGTVALDGGTITFTPTADLCGVASAGFDYTVEDPDGGTATGHVSIDLDCVNDDPVAVDDTDRHRGHGDRRHRGPARQRHRRRRGDSLSITDAGNATGGTVGLDGGVVTFTPTGDLCGDAAGGFDYTVSDGTTTDTGHVTVDITCVNDAPVAVDDDASGTEDTDVEIDAADLLADDTDADDADTKALTGVANATGGTVALDGGTITFTPTGDLCGDGVAGFDYTLEDGDEASDTGHVTIDLLCVNDAPVAVDDGASIEGNSPAADYDVLDNDTDVDDAVLTIESATVSAAQGTASVESGMVRFTPATNFSGTAVITYVVSDGDLTDTGTLTILVDVNDVDAPVVDAPTARFGAGRVDQTAPLLVTWSATDVLSGVTGYEVQVSIAGGAFKPLYAGTATSVRTFVPFVKTVVFRVRATDGAGNESGWVSSATRRVVAFQNENGKRIDYSGTWRYVAEPRSSGGGYAYATQSGASAKLSFRGNSVRYVAPKTPRSGKVRLYVDGALVGTFNLARPSVRFGQIIGGATWSTSGPHRVRIVAVNAGKRTNFDTFIVLK